MTTPNERLQRPQFVGPAITDTTSKPDQFAGRTTLGSGSTSVTVSTRQVNSDALINAFLEVAVPAAYVTQGRTSILSGIATGTASTSAVYSGAVINLTFESATNTASGVGKGFRVNSIVDGVSFAITAIDSFGYPATANVMWALPNAVPAGVKVNTISHQNYFTLGWSDGVARPITTTVLWELRKTS